MHRYLWILPLLLLAAPCLAGGKETEKKAAPLPEGISAFRFGTQSQKVKHSIPLEKVRKGLRRPDPKDGIPAILKPRFVSVTESASMAADKRVIVVEVGEDRRAYPLYILDRHELVNDVVGDLPLLITWCPLCGSAVVYERTVSGHVLTFGVSGYLYQSDVLMYDHQTESFWSQLRLQAVLGPLTGTAIPTRPCRITTLGAFRKACPEGKVLSEDQGILPPAAYEGTAYGGYTKTPRLFFQVDHRSLLMHPKAEVVGVDFGDQQRAYDLAGLRALSKPLEDEVGGTKLILSYTKEGDGVHVRDAQGKELQSVRLFWFAWYTFHPKTDLWRAEGKPLEREKKAAKPKQPGTKSKKAGAGK